MNRGQQQPQQRPQNLAPGPGMTQFNRQPYPSGYSNVPPRGSMPQSYPALQQQQQQHRPQSILPQTPSYLQRGGAAASYFGPNQVMGGATGSLQPSPNPPLPSLQPSQNAVQLQQQQQQQHQLPSGATNGLSQHLSVGSSVGGGGQSGSATPANANTTGTSSSDSGLDPNDFPALGSGAGAQANNSASTAPSSVGSLLNSYASQAGTAIGNGPGSMSLGGVGGSSSSVNGPSSGPRDFGPEDFPALGGPQTQTTTPAQGQQQQPGQVQADGHSVGINGNSFQRPLSSQQQRSTLQDQSQGQQRTVAMGGIPIGSQNMIPSGMSVGQTQSRTLHGFPSEADKRSYLKMNLLNPWPQAQQANSSGYVTNGVGQSTPSHGLPPGVSLPSSFNGQAQQNHSQNQLHSTSSFSGQSQPSQMLQMQQHQQQHPDPPPNLSMSSQNNSSQSSQQQHPTPNQSALPQTPAQQILLSAADRWGLLGLLASIKGGDPDAQMLAIGSDLSGMGLDMNTNGNLYSVFITPWSDSSAALSIEPEFHLPACYNVSTPAPGPAKAASFSDETLFFMFYSSPKDTLQEIAAQELHNRNWRFHKEARLWLTKESGQTPFQKGATFERGTYTFFDPESWEKTKREATIYYEQLEDRTSMPPPITGAGINSVPPQMGMGNVAMPMGMQAGVGVSMGQMQQPLGMRG